MMNRFFRDIPCFVEVARQKSFSRAADNLDMPVSTLSRRIQSLEREIGTQLFYRSARRVDLTDNGRDFFERCSSIVADVEVALEDLSFSMKSPSGPVRVSMQAEAYQLYLVDCINTFASRYPGIQMHLLFSERWVDLHSEPVDLDLRMGPLPDSTFKARRLFTIRPVLYASSRLMKFHSKPEKPEDLTRLPCIVMAQQNNVWVLRNGQTEVRVSIKPAHVTNTALASLELGRAGLGVIWQLPVVMKPLVASGEFVPLLPDWWHFDVNLSAVMGNGRLPLRVRLFVDHLAEHFSGMPE